MDKLGPEDHTYHATKKEWRGTVKLGRKKERRTDVLELAGMQILQIFAQVFKKETKCQLLIFPNLPTSQKPNGSSSNNRSSSSKVLAFDVKDILKLIELGEVRDILGGVTTNSVNNSLSRTAHFPRKRILSRARADFFQDFKDCTARCSLPKVTVWS